MGNKQETITDIIAEKRRRADEIERDCAKKMKRGEMVSDCYARELVADIRREADRLEAAHKREKAAVGDVAKLREACAKAAESAAEIMERVRRKDGLAFNTANYIAGIAKAALAAPPRNCDRFASAEEAWDAYDVWVESYRSKGKTEPFNEFGWLFAPATEQKGETDGSK